MGEDRGGDTEEGDGICAYDSWPDGYPEGHEADPSPAYVVIVDFGEEGLSCGPFCRACAKAWAAKQPPEDRARVELEALGERGGPEE